MIAGRNCGGVVLALIIAGCTVGPDYKRPEVIVPDSFAGVAAAGDTTQPAAPAAWWTMLKDPTLDSLINRAITSSLDLRIAAARVREARAQRGIAASGAYPSLEASGSYRRIRTSENAGVAGALGSDAGGGIGVAGGTQGGTPGGIGGFEIEPEQDLYQTGFDASWEIDIFGGVRREIEAADANVGVAQESRRDVLLSLMAEVARNYVEARGLQQQLRIALQNMRSQQETVEVTQARFKAGLTGELDVQRAEAQVATTASQIPLLRAGIKRAIHRLAVLLGQEPNALLAELGQEGPIPTLPAELPVGLPSDLLRRRPDIRRAERQLAAATAQIGVATADLFPRFSLTGSLGLQSNKLADLGNRDSRYWSLGPGVTWPIFNAGRIRSNVRVQNARQEQALLQYEQTILTALEDVENALVNYTAELARRQSLANAVKANRRAVELASELYAKGLVDFLSVLEAQRSLFVTEEQLVQSERAAAQNLIALYKALGGGWETQEEPSPAKPADGDVKQ